MSVGDHTPVSSMTDGILPDEVNCSAQNHTKAIGATISPVVPAAASSLVLLVVTVVLVIVLALVAKRKYQRNPHGTVVGGERERLVPTETVDPGYGEHALSPTFVPDDIISACMTHATVEPACL